MFTKRNEMKPYGIRLVASPAMSSRVSNINICSASFTEPYVNGASVQLTSLEILNFNCSTFLVQQFH